MLIYEREIKDKEEAEKIKEEEKRQIQDRVINYSKYVREMYYPKTSTSKVKKDELEEIKERL